jgi:hypothetical protein
MYILNRFNRTIDTKTRNEDEQKQKQNGPNLHTLAGKQN